VGLFSPYGVGKNSSKGNWFYNRKTGEASEPAQQYEISQASACFIYRSRMTCEDIMRLAYSEGDALSNTGRPVPDLTPLRSSKR